MVALCRPYRGDDREALVSLWRGCDLTRPWNDPYRDIERKLSVDADNLLVLEDGDRLIGSRSHPPARTAHRHCQFCGHCIEPGEGRITAVAPGAGREPGYYFVCRPCSTA